MKVIDESDEKAGATSRRNGMRGGRAFVLILDQQQEVIDAVQQLVGLNVEGEREVGVLAELARLRFGELGVAALGGADPENRDEDQPEDRHGLPAIRDLHG